MDISLYRSDIQEMIKEIGTLRGKDPKACLDLCAKLLEYGESRRDDALIGFSHFSMGEIYYMLNDMPTFYLEMLKALKPFEKIREWGYLAAAYNMFGIMALNRGNISLAMDYYYKAYEMCKEHKLFDLQSRVHMNMGGMYLVAGLPDDAMEHFEASHKYVANHMNMDHYVETLTAILLGRGKTYLAQGNIEGARAMADAIEQQCISFLHDAEKIAVFCFYARLCQQESNEASRDGYINGVVTLFTESIPVMDMFDDIYDFLVMLMDIKKDHEFLDLYSKVLTPSLETTVKNLEKKLKSLMLRFYKEHGMKEEFATLSENFIELLDSLETENALMVSSMISLRKGYHRLKEENLLEKKANRLLKKKSETDPLTGMSNRLLLNEYAEIAFDRAITNGVAFAIELMDIDYFKEYNDNYGHQAGDECLQFIAKSIMDIAKNHLGVFCFRYGGDEFVIIYESFNEQEVFNMAKELKNNILDSGRVHEYSKADVKFVTISQGIYWGTPKDGDNIWEYLQEADHLLYKVKQKSRNSIMLGKSKHHEDEKEAHPHGDGAASKPLISEVSEEDF